MAQDKLKLIPLGGLGEFGMNCMALRWQDDILVIDAGLMFPEEELLGVDIDLQFNVVGFGGVDLERPMKILSEQFTGGAGGVFGRLQVVSHTTD